MKVAIIIGAVRQARKTPQQAKWVMKTLEAMEDADVELDEVERFCDEHDLWTDLV